MFSGQGTAPGTHWMETEPRGERLRKDATIVTFLAPKSVGAAWKSAESKLWLSHLSDDRMPLVALGPDDRQTSTIQLAHDDSPWVLPPRAVPRPASPIPISRLRRYRRMSPAERELDKMYARYYEFEARPLFAPKLHLSDDLPFEAGTGQLVSLRHASSTVERQLFAYWAQWACDRLPLAEFPWPPHLGDYFELREPAIRNLRHPKDLYCRFRPIRPVEDPGHVEIWSYDRLANDLQAYQLRYAKMYHRRFGQRCCARLVGSQVASGNACIAYPPLISPHRMSTHGRLPRLSDEQRDRYTLALDLDGTLAYCAHQPLHSNGKGFAVDADATRYYLYARPHLREFLESMLLCYEMVLFTTASEDFAERAMQWLNREKKYVRHCLHRKHVLSGHESNSRLKHLRDLGRDMRKTVLVDNQLRQAVANWPNSALVKRWVGDPKDRELLHITPALQGLVGRADVRPSLERLPCNSYAAKTKKGQGHGA